MVIEFLPIIAAAVTAGISWSSLAVFSLYKNGQDATVDWLKVRKNVIVGSVLGVIGWALAITGAVGIPPVETAETFIAAVVAFFPLIVVADKLFVKKEEAAKDDLTDDDSYLDDDEDD